MEDHPHQISAGWRGRRARSRTQRSAFEEKGEIVKFVKLLALGLVAMGAGLLSSAPPAAASSEVLCVAEAFRANGRLVRGTRAEVTRFRERRACRVALRRCERRLDRVRYARGRAMPFARCEVTDIYRVSTRRSRDVHWCNYDACASRYRSFRARDCSFQPYHGPRRRCNL